MAIHDVDLRNDYDRLNPIPNSPDHLTVDSHGVLSMQAKSTESISHRAEGTVTGAGRVVMKNDRIIFYVGNVAQGIFGVLPDGTFGVALSKSGIDIFTAF